MPRTPFFFTPAKSPAKTDLHSFWNTRTDDVRPVMFGGWWGCLGLDFFPLGMRCCYQMPTLDHAIAASGGRKRNIHHWKNDSRRCQRKRGTTFIWGALVPCRHHCPAAKTYTGPVPKMRYGLIPRCQGPELTGCVARFCYLNE